jgi:hypothetical protein
MAERKNIPGGYFGERASRRKGIFVSIKKV